MAASTGGSVRLTGTRAREQHRTAARLGSGPPHGLSRRNVCGVLREEMPRRIDLRFSPAGAPGIGRSADPVQDFSGESRPAHPHLGDDDLSL